MIEQEYRTDRGRKRRRAVRIEVDEVLEALGPPPGPQDHASWLKIRELLIEAVGESTFEIWLATTIVIGVDRAGALVLDVSSDVHGWVQARFGRVIEACAAKASRTVRFATEVESAAAAAITAAERRTDNVAGERPYTDVATSGDAPPRNLALAALERRPGASGDAGDARLGAPQPDSSHADERTGDPACRSSRTSAHAASYRSLNPQERKVS